MRQNYQFCWTTKSSRFYEFINLLSVYHKLYKKTKLKLTIQLLSFFILFNIFIILFTTEQIFENPKTNLSDPVLMRVFFCKFYFILKMFLIDSENLVKEFCVFSSSMVFFKLTNSWRKSAVMVMSKDFAVLMVCSPPAVFRCWSYKLYMYRLSHETWQLVNIFKCLLQ